jgi:hypothetical protein
MKTLRQVVKEAEAAHIALVISKSDTLKAARLTLGICREQLRIKIIEHRISYPRKPRGQLKAA